MVSCRSHILVKLEFGDIGDGIRLLWGGEIQRNCRKTLRAREEPTTNVTHIWHWVGGQHSHYWAIPALQMLMPEGLAEFHNHTVILKQNQIRHPNYYILNIINKINVHKREVRFSHKCSTSSVSSTINSHILYTVLDWGVQSCDFVVVLRILMLYVFYISDLYSEISTHNYMLDYKYSYSFLSFLHFALRD